MVDLRETLIIPVLVFMGKVEETGANVMVDGRGGRGGGVHNGIREAVDPNLFTITGGVSCSIGVCEPDFSSDVSDENCTAESDVGGRGSTGEGTGWGITVPEDGAIDEALDFGIISLDGTIVCGSEGTSVELECEGPWLSSVLPSIPK